MLIRVLPRHFEWKSDLKPNEVVVGVLKASDGSCSHAITIHENYIYDANETVALRLCDEALDYCTSTAEIKSSFVSFWRGYRFFYDGGKRSRCSRMSLAAVQE